MSRQNDLQAARVALRKAERRAEDVRMIRTPNNWPRWPLLPVKRASKQPGAMPECAILTEDAVGFRLYDANMFEIAAHNKKLTDAPFKPYPTAEAVVDDGWTVD